MNELQTILKRSWQSHFWTNLATIAVLTLSFSLVFGAFLCTRNLSQVLAVWGDEIQITAYLKDNIAPDQKNFLETLIKTEPGFNSVEYVDKDQAFKSFEKGLSSYGPKFMESINSAGENPFPASFAVRLKKNYANPEKIEALAKKLGQVDGVEDVSYGQEWLRNYTTLMKVTRSVASLVALIILIGCLFTVSNSIQASLSSRRDEIEILELVGATAKSIRTPFLVEGAFQGFLAAVLSLLLLDLFYRVLVSMLENLMGASSLVRSMSFLPLPVTLIFILCGTLLGSLGSYICVANLNTGWAAVQQSKA